MNELVTKQNTIIDYMKRLETSIVILAKTKKESVEFKNIMKLANKIANSTQKYQMYKDATK